MATSWARKKPFFHKMVPDLVALMGAACTIWPRGRAVLLRLEEEQHDTEVGMQIGWCA
jgi:hypothetical protein